MREDANWTLTLQRLRHVIARRVHVMHHYEGWDDELFWWDTMHNLYIGPGGDLVGSCMSLLIELGWYGNEESMAVICKRASLALKATMKKHGVYTTCPSFTPSNLNLERGKVAGFSIPGAAHIKHALFFCAEELKLASMYYGDSCIEVQRAASCLYSLVSWIQCLDKADMILTLEEVRLCQKLGRRFLRGVVKLAAVAIRSHVLRWKIRPKLHYLDHTMRELRNRLNPRFFQCFLEEDHIGRVSRLAAQVHRRQVGPRTLERYFLLLARRFFRGAPRCKL